MRVHCGEHPSGDLAVDVFWNRLGAGRQGVGSGRDALEAEALKEKAEIHRLERVALGFAPGEVHHAAIGNEYHVATARQLDATGTVMAPNTTPVPLLVPDEAWQAGMVEAPDLVETGGRYLLFYSGNYWGSSNYGVGYATCSGPLGPCQDASAQPLLASGSGVSGPGGESIVTDSSGATWLAFAAWTPGQVGYPHSREFYLRRLALTGPSPSIGGARVG